MRFIYLLSLLTPQKSLLKTSFRFMMHAFYSTLQQSRQIHDINAVLYVSKLLVSVSAACHVHYHAVLREAPQSQQQYIHTVSRIRLELWYEISDRCLKDSFFCPVCISVVLNKFIKLLIQILFMTDINLVDKSVKIPGFLLIKSWNN